MSPYHDVCTKSKETIKKSASRNIRFIQTALSVVKSTRISPYSCKYSKRLYTQHQLLVLILFKDYRNQHYREFVEDIGDMEGVQESLDLSEVPRFTTLQADGNTTFRQLYPEVYKKVTGSHVRMIITGKFDIDTPVLKYLTQ